MMIEMFSSRSSFQSKFDAASKALFDKVQTNRPDSSGNTPKLSRLVWDASTKFDYTRKFS
jgi:hypothetical protein